MNNLEREDLVMLFQSLELAIATARISLDADMSKMGKKMNRLVKLRDEVKSQISSGDRYGWEIK